MGTPFADDVMDEASVLGRANTALCFDGRGRVSLVSINGSGIHTLYEGAVPAWGGVAAEVHVFVSQSALGVVDILVNGDQVVNSLSIPDASLADCLLLACLACAPH